MARVRANGATKPSSSQLYSIVYRYLVDAGHTKTAKRLGKVADVSGDAGPDDLLAIYSGWKRSSGSRKRKREAPAVQARPAKKRLVAPAPAAAPNALDWLLSTGSGAAPSALQTATEPSLSPPAPVVKRSPPAPVVKRSALPFSFGSTRQKREPRSGPRSNAPVRRPLATGDESTELRKDFYTEHPDVTALSEAEVTEFRKKHEMNVVSLEIPFKTPIPRPVQRFDQAQFPDYIMSEIKKAGFDAPSGIQAQSWPLALSGRDVIGISRTGSGKTLGFLLPGMIHITAQRALAHREGPIMLVLAPTRELAQQIKGEVDKFSGRSEIKNTVVYGGASKWPQARELRAGVEIVVATPGRLLDFCEKKRGQPYATTNLRRVTYLVLDEADRMLDMGFEPSLRKIVAQIRDDRQTLLFSATWPQSIRKLSRDFMRKDAVKVMIGSSGLSANKNITQVIHVISGWSNKFRKLEGMLKNLTTEKILLFCATKRTCDQMGDELWEAGHKADVIHGDKEQWQREALLKKFVNGGIRILVATDVASRGLHVNDIDVVICFDMPGTRNFEDYVHRIGRTGRAGAAGKSFAFVDPKRDRGLICRLIELLHRSGQEIPAELEARAGRGRGRGRGGRGGRRNAGRSYGGRGGRGGGRGRRRGRGRR